MYSVFGEKSSDKQPFEFSLELGKNVAAIYYNAFEGESKLVNLKLNSNLIHIDGHAFDGCKISNDLYLPLTLKEIELYSFRGNDFKRILIPSSCYELSLSIFDNCKNLTDIIFNVPSTAKLSGVLDGNDINSNCTVYVRVEDLDAYKANGKFKNIKIMPGAYDFSYKHLNDATPYHMTVISHSQVTASDGITYDGKAKYVYNPFVTISSPKSFYCSKSETDQTNNSGKKYLMVEMGDNCLYGASNITSVTLQDMTYLNRIGNQAFAGSGITSLTVPEGVTYFGEKAVYGCKSLTELIFNTKNTEWELGNRFYGNNGGQFYCFVPWEYYDFYRSKLPAGSSRPSEKAPREQLNAYLYSTMSGHKACLAVDHPVDWEKSGLKAWNVSDYDESSLTVQATPITATPANHGVLVDWYDLNSGSVQKLYRPQSTPAAPATVLTGVSEPLDIAPIGVWNVGYKYNPDINGVPNNETFNHPSNAYYIKPGYAYMALDKTRVTTTSGTYVKVVYGDTPTPGVRGDVDGNGVVDITDVNILINIVLGKDSASKYAGADVDGNGEVDITDVNTTLNLVLGK
ncbi:MAG: leucine-rich repeat protein [Bacteroidales bacterium]|nr:leucine-rich repeat protein [Candidatus Sodaliphilus limicaballi]